MEHEKKHTSGRVLGFLLSLGTGIGGGDLSTVDLPKIKGGEATYPRIQKTTIYGRHPRLIRSRGKGTFTIRLQLL
jgi:hypothetical protein